MSNSLRLAHQLRIEITLFAQLAWIAVMALAPGYVAAAASHEMIAKFDRTTGRATLSDGDKPILTYNYFNVDPPAGLLQRLPPRLHKYAQPRSNYIHPLHGPDGELLTYDWSKDHPHHRGIYWAWPEVDYQGQRADLHALEGVFALPTGAIEVHNGDGFAEIEAENLWKWNDRVAIVRELVVIRAYRNQDDGRYIDLRFSFTAIEDEVSVARRGTDLYGGLNFRFAPAENLQIVEHTDPSDATPRRSWGDIRGIWDGGSQTVGVAIFEKQSNPFYPGQWVSYPNLPWLQPAFPAAGERFVFKKGAPLVLEFRLWLRRGNHFQEEEYAAEWERYQAAAASSRHSGSTD